MRGMGTALPVCIPGRAPPISIRDLQAKLNSSRSTGIGNGAEAASERPLAQVVAQSILGADSDEGGTKIGSETARCCVNVPVKDVEELRTKVDGRFFAEEPRFFTQ